MSAGSIGYLTKEGLRNVWINRLMSFASVGVLMSCLVMIGLAFLSFVNVQALLDKVDDQNVIMVFVENDISNEEIERVGNAITAISNVSDYIYHSAEEKQQGFLRTK